MTSHSMKLRMAQMEMITNNLANINTRGFKRDGLFVNELKKQIAASQATGNGTLPQVGSVIDFGQGELTETGRTFDVGISGPGLFTVETPQGEAYTRDGRFTLNQDGILTTIDGLAVLGQGGPVEIDLLQNKPSDIIINDRAEVLVNGNVVEALKIVATDDPMNFRKLGGNLYQIKDGGEEPQLLENPVVKQGFLEESNVNPISEMVAMIEVFRAFQTNEKLVQSEDALLNKAVNDIGRVG